MRNTLIKKLNGYDADKPIQLYPIVQLFTLDVVCGKQFQILLISQ